MSDDSIFPAALCSGVFLSCSLGMSIFFSNKKGQSALAACPELIRERQRTCGTQTLLAYSQTGFAFRAPRFLEMQPGSTNRPLDSFPQFDFSSPIYSDSFISQGLSVPPSSIPTGLKRVYSSPVSNHSYDLPNSRLIAQDPWPEFVGFCVLG